MTIKERIYEAGKNWFEKYRYDTYFKPCCRQNLLIDEARESEIITVITELEERIKALENKEKYNYERIVQV